MSSYYEWWEGRERLQLSPSEIDADWARGEHSGEAISLLNKAFDVFYQARRGIAACPDSDMAYAMTQELEDAATTGCGIGGPDDLKEAFQHVEKNNHRWTDNATRNYYGGTDKLYSQNLCVTAPKAAVKFLDAMEAKLTKLKDYAGDLGKQAVVLRQATQGSTEQWSWEQIGKALKEIESKGGKAKKFLFWAPSSVTGPLGQVVDFVSVLGKVHDGATYAADIYAVYRHKGTGEVVSHIALDAAIYAVGYVPILGSFYAQALRMIPAFKTWMEGQIERHLKPLRDAGVPVY